MEKKADYKFILVREDVLPEAMKKTLQAKDLLERGAAVSVGDAAQKVDLSRSAFYKYRDTVFPFHSVVKEKIVTLFFYLEDRSGTLSEILRIIASYSCNVLTIHQTIPIQGRANVTISLNVSDIHTSLNDLLDELSEFEFVNKVEILGSGA
ncbi:ACT domain-containing protein [Heyndrickxia acidiproducens]|uniref:ACT domain-containing protein n=1 Tax=Heyndrickxia acidiproducens TaxID=1121084 RepID=UPI00036C6C54|nr:ACT domain-containing protein [Heyndrickxia acidiproducens]